MDTPHLITTISKLFIGSLFLLYSSYYLYKTFLSRPSPKSLLFDYISSYLHSLKELLLHSPPSELSLLTHLNFLIDQLTIFHLNESHSSLLHLKRSICNDESQYPIICKEYFKVKQQIKQNVIDTFHEDFDFVIEDTAKGMLKSSLINVDKGFVRLIGMPWEMYREVVEKCSKEVIGDAFYFASCKQIEYDRMVEEMMNEINTSSVEDDRTQVFKERFKDVFVGKYGFDCMLLPEVIKEVEGEEIGRKMNCLINRIIY